MKVNKIMHIAAMQETLSPVGSAYLPYFLQAQSICLALCTDSFPQLKLLDDLLHVSRLATSALTLKHGTRLRLRVGVKLWTGMQAEAQMFICQTAGFHLLFSSLHLIIHPCIHAAHVVWDQVCTSCEYLPRRSKIHS